MRFPFDLDKAIQAAAALLRAHVGQQMDMIRLLKLLYIADRRQLQEDGWPIIGHKYVALDYGPLHSAIYDLIKGVTSDAVAWSRHIARQGHTVLLAQDPGVGKLSASEIQTLEDVATQYANVDDWQIVRETHGFEEWLKNYRPQTSTPIALEDVLAAVGFSPAEEAAFCENLRELEAARAAEAAVRGA